MTEPKVSVCIVTYNQEGFIKDTIEGALMQKGIDYEIIIADDCSTDGTTEICKEYQNRYPDLIKLIKQTENKGIINNTKDCLSASTGKYIAICEGDDYWIDPEKLKKQAKILDSEPDVSLVHTNWIDLWVKDNKFVHKKVNDSNYDCETTSGEKSFNEIFLAKYRGIRFSSVCFRRSLLLKAIEEHDLYSEDFTTLDVAIFYEMAYRGRFAFLADETMVYRCLWESVSSTREPGKKARFETGVLAINSYYVNSFGIKKDTYQPRLRQLLSNIVGGIMISGDKKTAYKVSRIVKTIDFRMKITHKMCIFSVKHPFLGFPIKRMYKMIDSKLCK